MNLLKSRALTLLAATALVAAACQGPKAVDGANGADGAAGANGTSGTNGTDGGSGSNGTNGTNGTSGVNAATTGLALTITSTTVNADQTVSVRFTMKDDQGYPVDAKGKYSVNTVIAPKFALAYLIPAADGSVPPYKVLSKAVSHGNLNPTAFTPPAVGLAATSAGQIVENGTAAGDYTYTFPVSAALVDATKTHTIWIQATRQTDLTSTNNTKTFKAVNASLDFIPGSNAPALKREIVKQANCDTCHNGFKPDGLVSNPSNFHGGGRVDARYCDICHNTARISTATNSDGVTPAAASGVFVHRIHNAKKLQTVTTGTSTVGYQFAAVPPATIPTWNACGDGLIPTGSTVANPAPCVCTPAVPCRPTVFDGIGEVTYPQDLRNCNACHKGAAQGGQSKTTVTRAVCGSCHDYVDFTGTAAVAKCTDPVTVDANGIPVPCYHLDGTGVTQDDTQCAGCHSPNGASYSGIDPHIAVIQPDPGNTYEFPVTTGTSTTGADFYGTACTATAPCTCTVLAPCFNTGNNNTNAAFLAAAGAVPAGATQISYSVKSVSAFNDTSVTPNVLRPQIVFKFQQSVDGAAPTDVVFNTFGSGKTELIDGFVGSPSVYFAYAVPQDGITSPADFNASQSGYIKNIWNGNAIGSGSGTMTGPDGSGYYTITLGVGAGSLQTSGTAKTGWLGATACTSAATCACTAPAPCRVGAMIPATAKMLTGGVGYTYGLQTTQPLTQIAGVQGYPYDAATKIGGLLVPAHDVTVVGTDFTGRRAIVENNRCLSCHAALGAAPTFHAGQRNDGPTCSFCHNANQVNSGWSGNSKDFIHGLHAGVLANITLPDGTVSAATGVRNVPFGWHALSPTEGYWDVTFPGQHANCEACHASGGTYDFSAAASAAAVPNLLWSTEATGTTVGATPGLTAPYIAQAAGTVYGSGFAVDKANGIITAAATTTLVTSPITAACVACHDSAADRGHMTSSGGSFYVARSAATPVEQCLICHGSQPGAIMPIADAHK